MVRQVCGKCARRGFVISCGRGAFVGFTKAPVAGKNNEIHSQRTGSMKFTGVALAAVFILNKVHSVNYRLPKIFMKSRFYSQIILFHQSNQIQ